MTLNKKEINNLAQEFFTETAKQRYSYNFTWMGRQIIQYPQDIVAMQEIIWKVKPELIIETGIAHGGSLIFYASMLELLSISGFGEGSVLGIDIDIREHNRVEIEAHSMFKRIDMIEGSSIDDDIINKVKEIAKDKTKIMLVLDSNHSHNHVLAELEAFAPLVSSGSYCVVLDSVIEDLPNELQGDRPWGVGNNPKTALWEYLEKNTEFIIDREIQEKLLITVAPDGYLKRE